MKHYLDHNATTPVAPEVVDAMLPYLREHFGNPSSPHAWARAPALAIAKARQEVAALLNASPRALVFTSGGTESNALAIRAALAQRPDRRHLILSAVEHAAVIGWHKRLADEGYRVTLAPVYPDGSLDLASLDAALTPQTALVCVMLANNETGIVYPVQEIAARAHAVGALVHTDAVQAAGKIPVDVEALGVDYAALCGHKIHAVKGIGAIYARRLPTGAPLMPGGEQEGGVRPGTEPVASIVALGAACTLAREALAAGAEQAMAKRRDAFEQWLEANIPRAILVGRDQPRLPNTTLVLLPGIETEPLLALLDMDGIACSSGSACASGAHEPSHVLRAMQRDDAPCAVLRISASRTTPNEAYTALRQALPAALHRLA